MLSYITSLLHFSQFLTPPRSLSPLVALATPAPTLTISEIFHEPDQAAEGRPNSVQLLQPHVRPPPQCTSVGQRDCCSDGDSSTCITAIPKLRCCDQNVKPRLFQRLFKATAKLFSCICRFQQRKYIPMLYTRSSHQQFQFPYLSSGGMLNITYLQSAA